MKKLFFLTCLSLTVVFVSKAQKNEEVYDKMAAATCDCISKKTDFAKKNQQEKQMELGICLLESATPYEKELAAIYPEMNQESMRTMGEKVGLRMASKCPSILMAMAGTDDEEEPPRMTTVVTQSMKGTIKKVQGTEFATVVVEDETGRSHQFLWLRYFKGADDLQNSPEKIIGKKVKISYQEIECYVPQTKNYFKKKEISAVELQ